MSEEKMPETLFGFPVREMPERTISLTGIEFSPAALAHLFAPPTTPVRLKFGRGRRPTRRKLRLCARTGHPASRLGYTYDMDTSIVWGEDITNMQFTPHSIAPGRYCERCGADVIPPTSP